MQLSISLLASIETALNVWLKLDNKTLPKFNMMQGKIICLQITGLDLTLYFLPAHSDIAVMGNYVGEPDTTIKGAPITLMRLGISSNSGKTLLESNASIEGDTQLGAEFSRILSEVDIDWENILSTFVGDVIAEHAGQVAYSSKEWVKDLNHTFPSTTSDYLTDETQLVPAAEEVNHYLDQVDQLRMRVDRLDARVKVYMDKVETKNT
ncbi:MAG: SCP2 sterol-binding domain-containing protein [Cocleimonas sp.]|nr:SCP2 sterol-binding domain-containing protein [Cocleimonas sp.]